MIPTSINHKWDAETISREAFQERSWREKKTGLIKASVHSELNNSVHNQAQSNLCDYQIHKAKTSISRCSLWPTSVFQRRSNEKYVDKRGSKPQGLAWRNNSNPTRPLQRAGINVLFGQNLQPQHLSAWFHATALLSPCPDSNIIKFPFLLFWLLPDVPSIHNKQIKKSMLGVNHIVDADIIWWLYAQPCIILAYSALKPLLLISGYSVQFTTKHVWNCSNK